MPNLDAVEDNNIDLLRRHIADYFGSLSHGIPTDDRHFECMNYINFVMVDLLSSFCYSLRDIKNRKFFIDELKVIVHSLEKYYDNAQI